MSDAISFDDLVATYRVLVHSGAPIAQINAVRNIFRPSRADAWRVAAAPAHQLSIMISDVPDDAMDSLASGPTMPDTSTVDSCYDIVARYNLLPQLPPSVGELFATRALEETPKAGDPVFERARWWPVLSNVSAQKAAAERAASSASPCKSTTVATIGTIAKPRIICSTSSRVA